MTPLNNVIAYSRFLECQERRRRVVSELALKDQPRTVEVAVVPEPSDAVEPKAPASAATQPRGLTV
jgi:hypothetical protein